jgi:uncharacterized protein
MNTEVTNPDKTVAALIHLSAFSKYCFPFGNFIIPLILWTAKKENPFVDEHGKQALNFQISIFLYFIFLVSLAIAGVIFLGIEMSHADPFIISEEIVNIGNAHNAFPVIIYLVIIGFLMLGLFLLDTVAVIIATIKASEGSLYKYPLTIKFITTKDDGINQSKNEQFDKPQN